jgi:hypothetical protein
MGVSLASPRRGLAPRVSVRSLWAIATLAVAVALCPPSAWAQAVKGTLLGTVTDSQGAAVPGANVTVTETGTNITRTAQTNASGNYVFSNLKDGTYRVGAELSGFRKFVRDGVIVAVNTTVRVDVALQVGDLSEEFTVVGETPTLQTDRADTGRLIESTQITETPLAFNRNFQGLLITVPGATRPYRPHSEFFNSQDSLSSEVNGQSRMSNNVMLDGIDDNHKTGLLTVLIPSADAIETVSVSTSNYEAEFGRAGGAVTNVTLKSGTNLLKGSAFFFGNNESTQAKNYFAAKDSVKAATSYKQFGATLGGPIIKDKLFFFADYQGTHDKRGAFNLHNVPPADFRNGDFSKAGTTIYDPATGNADGTGRLPFPGNIIPASRISPIARRILGLLPGPNRAAALGQNNYEFPSSRQKDTEAFDVKLNYQASPQDSFSYRFSFQRPKVFDPGTYGVYGGPANGGFAGTGTNKTFSTALNWTHTLGSNSILDVRAGLSYYHNVATSQGVGLNTASDVGITGANLDEFTSGMTQITINNGYANPVIGFASSLPWDRSEKTYDVASTLTSIKGNHTVKVGFDVRHNRDFLLQVLDFGGSRGEFVFSGAQTATPADTAAQNGYANAFASFLLGLPSTIRRDLKVIDPGTQHWGVFTFIQDKWQVSQKLTVDIGLRHEYYTPLVGLESKGGLSNFDPTTNTLQVAGYGGVPDNLGVKSTWDNFAPRLGASYRINDATVLRGGFGISIIPFPDNRYAFNFPVRQNNVFNAPNSFAPAGRLDQGFPAPITATIPDSGIINADTSALLRAGYDVVPLDLKEGKIRSWNVAIQRQLPAKFALEVAYVGNRTHGAIKRLDLNAGLVPGLDNAGRPGAKFNRTAGANTWYPTNAQYDSMQVKLDRRFSNGLLWTNSYTLSRGKDFGSDGGALAGISTPADISRSFGLSTFDRTHSFVSSAVYQLPFFKEQKGVAGVVLGGWQVSGVFVAQSGTPIDITTSNATLRAPGNTQRPNLVGDQKVTGKIGPGQQWFDTSVYAAPAANTFGGMTRNEGPRGPHYINLDASLVKRIRVNQRVNAELRADAFNVTNTGHFNDPNGTFGNATFGQITGAFGERYLRFGARVTF